MKQIKNKRVNHGVFIIFILLCIITGIFCFQYYSRLQKTIRDESNGYLQEIARRIADNINRIIDDNYAVLNSISALLETNGAGSFSDVHPIVGAPRDYWNYHDIFLIDENGKAYSSLGQEIILNNDTYFDSAVLNKKQGISTTQMIGNKESIMLSVPLDDMVIDGKNMVALAASYSPASFDQTLSMNSFNGQAYSCIISGQGTIVVRSSAEFSISLGYNVLNTISRSSFDQGSSIDKIKTDISNDVAGQVGFTIYDARYYMVYTPVNPQGWYLLTFVPSSVVNAKSDMLLKITLVICGLITMLFAGLVSFLLFTFYRNKQKLERIAYVDEVTGGNTIQRFYELAKTSLERSVRTQYALIFTNLAKFKILNEQFGRHTCDMILKSFYKNIERSLRNNECVGRLSADNFCILMEFKDEKSLLDRFLQWYQRAENYVNEAKPIWSLPVTEFGVFVIDNDTIPFPQMIDRAKLALRESSHNINSRLRYAIYNDEVRRRLFRDKQLEDMMDASMQKGEFQIYLQPKYQIATKRIGGAEALTRWVNASEGMIYPDEFIPLFEKNGFIETLDLWIFEEACRCLREWIEKGLEPVKISVNCSRVHLKNSDFLKSYSRIADKYRVPHGLLEIEVTESVVMENAQQLTRLIEEIHAEGFECSMDDFGSGYSSLNLIQSIPVDTLKLDKVFFHNEAKTSKRLESVLRSIISMAKALSMDTVAEGVEYEEQVHMLEEIGCDYIQGYVFAKPMPVSEFEKLAFARKDEE